MSIQFFYFFFFNDTATTEIYTLSLHDALPISPEREIPRKLGMTDSLKTLASSSVRQSLRGTVVLHADADRKSTRLNSSHANISYAVFCLKKKKNIKKASKLKKQRPYNINRSYR